MAWESPQFKREIPVEGPGSDSPGLKLQKNLTPRLSEDREGQLAFHITSNYNAALQDRGEWERRLPEWEAAYYNKVEPKVYPWPGAANFHVPLVMMGAETYKPRLVEGILGQMPPIIVVPTNGGGEERKSKVEDFLNWQVTTEVDLEDIVTQSAHLFLQPGMVFAKTSWEVSRVSRRYVREFPAATPMEEVMEALFADAQPSGLVQVDTLEWEGTIPTTLQAGAPLQVKLKGAVVPGEGGDIIQMLVEKEEVTERPRVDLPEPIDIIAPVKGGQDPNKLPWLIHRLWLFENDLRLKASQGRFYLDVVQELLDSGPPRGDQPVADSGLYRQSVDSTEGVEGYGPSNVRRWQYEVLECYLRYDIDEDGFDEEIIAWVTPQMGGKLLSWDYLDNVYAHGRRPFRVGRYFPIPFRWLGLSFAEVVKGIQDEVNTIHNQRVDYATIQNLPIFFYRGSSTLPAIRPQLRPGEGIAVDNVQDVFFPKWQGDQAWGQQEEALLMQHFERLTGLSDLSIGRQPNRVGATRTAAGTQTLLSEQGLRFKGILKAFQKFWVGVFDDILALDQEYLPPDKEFKVTGKRPTSVRIKDRSEIRGSFKLRCSASNETLNRQKQKEDSSALMQMVMNPAMMQAGIVGLKAFRWAMENSLKAYGKDPAFVLEDQAPILSPEQELMMFNAGEYVSPVQGEDLQAHMLQHQAALQDIAVAPEVKLLIQRHLQETMQLYQQQQVMQMQQQAGPPPGPQQAPNVAIGQAAPQEPAPATTPQAAAPAAPSGPQA